MTAENSALLSTRQAAAYLGVSASFLAKSRVTGIPAIPFCRIGVAVRYRLADLDAHITANTHTSTSTTKAA